MLHNKTAFCGRSEEDKQWQMAQKDGQTRICCTQSQTGRPTIRRQQNEKKKMRAQNENYRRKMLRLAD